MFVTKKKSKKKQEFESIIDFAKKVYFENPYEIDNLIRLLGKKVQLEYLIYTIRHENDYQMGEIEPRTVWFDPLQKLGNSGQSLRDLAVNINEKIEVSLANDLVLTNPWNRRRMLNACIHHGENQNRGSWKQDSNHFAELWLPMKITWVGNGNHSIAAGIIQRDGLLSPEEIYDISPVYDAVVCDGDQFIDIERDKPISTVNNVEFCAIYEIGRLIKTANK
ncbi:MAG: DUF6710 family protein [Candidatus Thiodiazotropha endolucinida]